MSLFSSTPSRSPEPAPTGFMVLHGNRLEDLRDLLVEFVRTHPLPPLQPEVILLQSNGMKHWLELALADDAGLGVCAATRMELPGTYLWQMYRAVLGAHTVPAQMPFDKGTLVWRLVRLLPQRWAHDGRYDTLRRYVGDPVQPRKLYQLAQQLADVLDAYQSYRADWLADWAGGRDVLRGPDGVVALAEAQAWQAQLWRDLRADVGPERMDSSRASVHAQFLAAMAQVKFRFDTTGQRPAGLPTRLVVFGVSSLPMQQVQALAALGQVCQVLLLVQNPCRQFWGDAARQARADTHPLLASWGQLGRDYLHLLDGDAQPEALRRQWSRTEVFVDPVATGERGSHSQLAQLQSDILNLRAPPATAQPLADDGSLEFVSAHSPQRELEVLHDRLLAWFDADPDLQPRDVMVMVPDMDLFAPHIQAVFGRHAPGQPGYIPYSVADANPRHAPMVQALAQLLSLPDERVSLLDWVSLFEVAPLRQRFAVTPADVTLLHGWLLQAGVRWGLDADHRRAWGVPADTAGLAQNTWAFALERLLLGYALGSARGDGPDALWQGTLAQPALSSLSAPLVQSLLDWLRAMAQTLTDLSTPQTPAVWGQTLGALVQRFFDPQDDAEEQQLERLLAPLHAWLDACADAALDTPLPLDVVREHWLGQIEPAGLQRRFFGGGVQFATLMPMRSIPFAVIALLGMNDGDYPRTQAARDFDLMATQWRAGDRSRREDDRYLFLEALLSARQKFYLSWQGHSASDNTPRTPSVLVAQLLDHVNACWSPQRAAQVQPLQPFSPVYVQAGSGFQTYAADWTRALAAAAQTGAKPAAGALDEAPRALALADLELLLTKPVEVYFRRRLQATLAQIEDDSEPEEPFALDGLQAWQLSSTVLHADPQRLHAHLRASGQLPLAAFGERAARQLAERVVQVQQRAAPWLARYPQDMPVQPVQFSLEGNLTLSGALAGLRGPLGAVPDRLQCLLRPAAVLEGPRHDRQPRGPALMPLWVNHLAACASGLPLTSVLIGIDGQVLLPDMPSAQALASLKVLVQAYRQAWRAPAPLACRTGWATLRAQAANAQLPPDKAPKDPLRAARDAFEGQPGNPTPGDWERSACLQRAFDGFEAISAALPVWAQQLYGDLMQWAQVGAEEVAELRA